MLLVQCFCALPVSDVIEVSQRSVNPSRPQVPKALGSRPPSDRSGVRLPTPVDARTERLADPSEALDDRAWRTDISDPILALLGLGLVGRFLSDPPAAGDTIATKTRHD